jgi:Tfp pilus assembly protein PilF
VKEYAPKEPPVYALLGQVYHRMGKNQDALRHFNIAIELDSKQAALLKVPPPLPLLLT